MQDKLSSDLKGFWCSFADMGTDDLYDLLHLRQDVFIVEQACLYPDIDGKDRSALHYLLKDVETGELAGALRIFIPTATVDAFRIGRVVISPRHRGKGLGRELMVSAIEKIRSTADSGMILISAQAYLLQFYTDLGFEKCSDVYDEDGIAHLDMHQSF